MASDLSKYVPNLTHIPITHNREIAAIALAAAGTVAALSAGWVIRDYNQWVAFGSGGTPPTPSGYWRMTKLRWWSFRTKDDLRDASPLTNAEGPKFLTKELPVKRGERPKIMARTMPQRQVPEPLDPAIRDRVQSIPKRFCEAHPDILVLDLSKAEGYAAEAIYARPSLPGRHPSAQDKILGNEIAHVHPPENSLHVWLSGPDAKQVVETGWGERFPLSSMGITHVSLVMVYAPKTMEDVEVIEEIVRAGVAYLTGVKIT